MQRHGLTTEVFSHLTNICVFLIVPIICCSESTLLSEPAVSSEGVGFSPSTATTDESVYIPQVPHVQPGESELIKVLLVVYSHLKICGPCGPARMFILKAHIQFWRAIGLRALLILTPGAQGPWINTRSG